MHDADHTRTVPVARPLLAETAGQRQRVQPAGAQRDPLCCRTRLQMARSSGAFRQLAHDLHAHESMGQTGRFGPCVRADATLANRPDHPRSRLARQHVHQGSSRRNGRVKKNGPQAIGQSRGGRTTKIHLVAADARTALTFSLSPGQAADDPEGRKLLKAWDAKRPPGIRQLLMDRAYEGDEMRRTVRDMGMEPVVPPKKNRLVPWEYDRQAYKRRNEVERLFRRLKGFRRIFTRFEKLDVMFAGFISFALAVDMLR